MTAAMLGLADWGYLLVDSGWKSLALLLAVAGADRFFLRRRLLAADAVWFVTLMLLMLLPLFSLLPPLGLGWQISLIPARQSALTAPTTAEPPIHANDSGSHLAASEPNDSSRAGAPSGSRTFDAGGVAMVVYLAVTTLLVLRLTAGYLLATRLARASETLDSDAWTSRLALYRQKLGIRRPVALRLSSRVLVPAMVGWRRPCILLPHDLGLLTDTLTIDAILLHELTHIARRDYPTHLCWNLCQAFYWWNPLVWHASRRAAEIREVIADGYCVAILGARDAYVGLLLETAKRLVARRAGSLAVAMARKPQLGRRLEFLYSLNVGAPWASKRHRLGVLAIGSVILVVAGMVHGVEPTPPASAKDAAANSTKSNAAKSGDAAIPGDNAANDSAPNDIPPAELLYLAWHEGARGESTADVAPPAYWDRSGKVLGQQRSAEIFEQTQRFVGSQWRDDEWRPLILVYKVDPRLTHSPIIGTIVNADGVNRQSGWFARNAPTNGLNVSTLFPYKSSFDRWPKQIAIEYTYPIEDPQIILTLATVPDDPVQIADGVSWYLDADRARERSGAKMQDLTRADDQTAGVLQTRRDPEHVQPLDTYVARIFLKDGKELQGLYVTIIKPNENEMYTINVSESFAGKDDIARVEFQRQRFRRAVVKDLPLRLDLKPDDKD